MLPMARIHTHRCHTTLKSPIVDAAPNTRTAIRDSRSGSRSASALVSNDVESGVVTVVVPIARVLLQLREMGRHRILGTTSESGSSCTAQTCWV